MKGCIFCTPGERFPFTFASGREEMLRQRLTVCGDYIHRGNLAENAEFLADCEVGFASWGMPRLTEQEIEKYLPRLKVIFYAAGSVQYFARPFLSRGVKIYSAWRTMATPVAEFTVAQILLANKGALSTMRLYRSEGYGAGKERLLGHMPGTYGTSVGILGAGAIGSLVLEMLKSYNVRAYVFDPFLSDERAAALGASRVSLEELFSSCQTISNHIANNPQTVGMLNYGLFSKMGDYATFINTGRGAQVVEEDLIRALREKPGRSAILDVTDPEPTRGELLSMDNVFLFPHIAGYARDEVLMLSDFVISQLDLYLAGNPLDERAEVTLPMLATMA